MAGGSTLREVEEGLGGAKEPTQSLVLPPAPVRAQPATADRQACAGGLQVQAGCPGGGQRSHSPRAGRARAGAILRFLKSGRARTPVSPAWDTGCDRASPARLVGRASRRCCLHREPGPQQWLLASAARPLLSPRAPQPASWPPALLSPGGLPPQASLSPWTLTRGFQYLGHKDQTWKSQQSPRSA